MREKKKLNRLMKMASVASIVTAITLVVVKFFAYLITGSVSILSSLFDSVQDFMTSAVNYEAVRHSIAPADREHRFGHGKAQAIGSLIQGVIIFAAAAFLLKEAGNRFFHIEPIREIGLGTLVTVFAIIVTIILVQFQTYVIKKTNSLSLKTDRAHYTGDILMNVGVVTSMVASYYFNLYVIDALFGIGVAFYLFITVFGVAKEAIAMLMDTEMPEDVREKIKQVAFSYEDVLEVVDLKTRLSGSCIFIQFCVRMNAELTLKRAHDITEFIEDDIKKEYPDSQIIIHFEPSFKRV
ncbi:MAG: cation transporter [Alphaproteobacteria bacterium]|nr:cation transporter [Alphaproteobacteria bacterium]